jgi:hypothetical protein
MVEQGGDGPVGLKNDAAARTSISTVRSSARSMPLSQQGYAPVSSSSGLDFDFNFIDKIHAYNLTFEKSVDALVSCNTSGLEVKKKPRYSVARKMQ